MEKRLQTLLTLSSTVDLSLFYNISMDSCDFLFGEIRLQGHHSEQLELLVCDLASNYEVCEISDLWIIVKAQINDVYCKFILTF